MRWPWRSRKPRDQDFDEEIQAHLAMAARDRVERGETPQAAESAARREFGNRTRIQELTREVWCWNSLDRLWQDVRYGLRTMRRAPAFTAVAVLSLALGIGANTAIFSLLNALLLRTLPVRDPGRLVELLHQFPTDPRVNGADFEVYEHLRDNNHVLSGLIAFSPPVESRASVGRRSRGTGERRCPIRERPVLRRARSPAGDRTPDCSRRRLRRSRPGGRAELVLLEQQVPSRPGHPGQANHVREIAGHDRRSGAAGILRRAVGIDAANLAAIGHAVRSSTVRLSRESR